MGAVSFQDVELNTYSNVYCHDVHGWRDTMATNLAFNVFTALTNERLDSVSFYTTADQVDYTVQVFDRY